MTDNIEILGVPVNVIDMNSALNEIDHWVEAGAIVIYARRMFTA